MAPIAFAKLIDKMTILEIKSEKFRDEPKRNVDHKVDLIPSATEGYLWVTLANRGEYPQPWDWPGLWQSLHLPSAVCLLTEWQAGGR